MGSTVRIHVERADREAVTQPGTVRNIEHYPKDVDLIDLSVSGALLACDLPMPVGALVTLGIPGIGMHAARISRSDDARMACAFSVPLTPEDVIKAKAAVTVFKADFDKLPVPHREETSEAEGSDAATPMPPGRLDKLRKRFRRLE